MSLQRMALPHTGRRRVGPQLIGLHRIGLSLLGVVLAPLAADAGAGGELLAQSAAEAPVDQLLIVDKSAGQIVVLNLESGQVTDKIDVGYAPHEVVSVAAAVSGAADTASGASAGGSPSAIVSLYGDGQRPGSELAIVDLTSGEVRLISLAPYSRPHGLAIVPGTTNVMVSVEQQNTVLLVDYQSGEIVSDWHVDARLPHMVVAAPSGAVAYASSITGAAVSRIEISGREPLTVSVGAGAEGIAVSADGSEVWVGSNDENELHILSDQLEQLDVLSTCSVPIRITRVGTDLMAATCYSDNQVQLFETESHEVRATVQLPGTDGRPVGTLATADGSRLYVATTADGRVHEIDVSTASVVRSFDIGVEPDGLALVKLQ